MKVSDAAAIATDTVGSIDCSLEFRDNCLEIININSNRDLRSDLGIILILINAFGDDGLFKCCNEAFATFQRQLI